MPYLITYRSDNPRVSWGHEITNLNPIEWLDSTQQHEETYLIVNALEISEDQAAKYHGTFKGM